MKVELDQALFGYDRGHHLVASSRRLGKDATWVLRSVTDMRVPKRNGHYLTVLPMPQIESHALVRTWAAGADFRPGSVWSHALLVPWVELDEIGDLRVLLSLFRRPKIVDPEALATLKATYGKKIRLPESPKADPAGPGTPIADDIVDRLVLAAYAGPDGGSVVVDDARNIESLLLGLMSQQWAQLRRRFSARTRYRPSQTSAAQFAIEVIERGSGLTPTPVTEEVLPWAAALASDLLQPDDRMRTFLRAYVGKEHDQPSAVAHMTDVYVSAAHSPSAAVNAIGTWFPRPSDQLELKQDLLGPSASTTRISDTWPKRDPERLQLLLHAPVHSFSLSDYQAGSRFAEWASEAPVEAAIAIVEARVPERSVEDLEELVTGVAAGFDAEWVGRLVGTLPALAPDLLAARPDVWSSPDIWTTAVDHGLLLDLIINAGIDQQRDTYLKMLANGLLSSASELLNENPTLWWSVADPEHAHHVVSDGLVLSGARRLGLSVTSTRGPSPWALTTVDQALVIASVADPDEGLWQNVPAGLWVQTYEAGGEPISDDRYGPVRRDVMALAAGDSSSDPAERRLVWSLVFPPLHQALFGTGTPPGCDRTLAALLPHGPSWDWCGRLRYQLAKTAVEDGWSDAQLRSVARGAGDFADEVTSAANAYRHRSHRSVVDEITDFFSGLFR